ncbi:hypothetical protein [Photobacterium phosphoreum]|uniref:hypothetical protein n=1 Tax=Photobacterium phosphoreum TaxID=659 RepID=UPI000D181B5D|nr:hypothetical protein [Photobacterium phosphoreum]MCD9478621.1 hypothetical protein [Photobacterium phosphoreum]MCD9483627.1 hypothetical protein [Photobacterium phosphoreum]MCD9509520.1 hypothetical protein [Photobacterium phosphoreum]PSU40972.1 hypothetical protein CTM85_00745 [Photobacterium phosphoreum]
MIKSPQSLLNMIYTLDSLCQQLSVLNDAQSKNATSQVITQLALSEQEQIILIRLKVATIKQALESALSAVELHDEEAIKQALFIAMYELNQQTVPSSLIKYQVDPVLAG